MVSVGSIIVKIGWEEGPGLVMRGSKGLKYT